MTEKNYEVIDGIKCFAPSLAKENTGFKEESFDHLFQLEENNFWFEGRAKIVKHFLKKFIALQGTIDFLEIGCGTGFMLKRFSELSNLRLAGSEIYLAGLHFAQKRLPNVEFIQLDATAIPFEKKYHAIGAFDVLEHIENDELVMREVHNALKDNGLFYVTVPQYMWMWSPLDDYACHKRRYRKRELREKLEKNGFHVGYIGSFVFLLFPFMAISRLLKKGETVKDPSSEFKIPRVVNFVFSIFMKVDYFFIRLGISLPFGGSLICVAKKV